MGLLDLFLNTKKWYIRNEETNETLQGQFPAQGLTLEVGSNYVQHTALNRQNAILQYLNGKNDTLSFQSMFYSLDFTTDSLIEDRINTLMSWARRNDNTGRPPVVTFWVGNGFVEQTSVIDSIAGITFDEPTITGGLRKVTFTVNLLKHEEFELNATEILETRYHRVRERDYFEMLCYQEYGTPNLGDVIRRRHPSTPNLVPTNIVKLPSVQAIRTERLTQRSIQLKTAFGRKDTPQRTLRQKFFDLRSGDVVSHVLVE